MLLSKESLCTLQRFYFQDKTQITTSLRKCREATNNQLKVHIVHCAHLLVPCMLNIHNYSYNYFEHFADLTCDKEYAF